MTEQDPAQSRLSAKSPHVRRCRALSVAAALFCAASITALMSMPSISASLPIGRAADPTTEAERRMDAERGGPSARLQRAIEAYDSALKDEPDNLLLLCERAQAHTEAGNFDAAIADYSRYIKIKPTASIYYNRGIVYHERKKD
ncbi:MAG: tetratricopeptide repeat protein, partial [Xanthobacteraceae bacterium]